MLSIIPKDHEEEAAAAASPNQLKNPQTTRQALRDILYRERASQLVRSLSARRDRSRIEHRCNVLWLSASEHARRRVNAFNGG